MTTILIIEDEEPIRELVRLNLELAGFDVLEAKDGLEGLNIIKKEEEIDLVILDMMLPKIDGFELLEELKKEYIPTICLTARDSLQDKVKGLELGADDYITKPFEGIELIARIKAVLRRTSAEAPTESPAIIYDNIRLETNQHRVFLDEEEVNLTLKEYELLLYLIEHKGSVVSREQLLQTIWGYDYGGNTRTVDMHIQRLRTKLKTDKIHTVYKVGYRLEE